LPVSPLLEASRSLFGRPLSPETAPYQSCLRAAFRRTDSKRVERFPCKTDSTSSASSTDHQIRPQLYAELHRSFAATLHTLRKLIDLSCGDWPSASTNLMSTIITSSDRNEFERLLFGPLELFGSSWTSTSRRAKDSSGEPARTTRTLWQLRYEYQTSYDLLLNRMRFVVQVERNLHRNRLSKCLEDMRVLLANNLLIPAHPEQLRSEVTYQKEDYVGMLHLAAGFSNALTSLALGVS
jgi:hypothetical protein